MILEFLDLYALGTFCTGVFVGCLGFFLRRVGR